MKVFIPKLLFVWLILVAPQSYAQHSIKQIDCLFDAATQPNALKADVKQAAIVYNASKTINYDKGIVEGLILYAKSSYEAGQYDKAFDYTTQAENAATKINDPILTSSIMTFKGLCYWRLGFYKEAEETFKSAILVAKTITSKEEAHHYLATIYSDLAVNYQHMGNLKAKEFWGEKGYTEAKQLDKSKKYLWVFMVTTSMKANSFIIRKQYDSAEVYLNKVLPLTSQCTHYYALWVVNIRAGDLYYAKKNFPNSALYYKEAVNAANQIKYAKGLKDAYDGLAKVYIALNKPGEALKYLERSNKLGDSLARLDKAAIKTPHNYIVKSKEQQLTANRHGYFRIMLLICILVIMVACAIIAYQKYKLRKSHSLKRESDKKVFVDSLAEFRKQADTDTLSSLLKLAKGRDSSYFIKFYEVYPDFKEKLLSKAPTLTINELELCTYIRMNFDNKEIARYTNTSVKSVESRKYRIKKKLGLNQSDNLNLLMMDLEL